VQIHNICTIVNKIIIQYHVNWIHTAQSADKQDDTVTCLGIHFSLELILVTVC
jgi:hypothetical protein